MSQIECMEAEKIRHLNKLIQYRNSGCILEAGKDWLDKEIFDLSTDLNIKELAV